MTAASLVRRHALVVFFGLATALSWASFYAFHGPAVFTLGPLVAALIVAAATGGVSAIRELAGRILRWRVKPLWYAAAVFVPIAIGAITAALTVRLGAPPPTAAQLGPWYRPFVLFAVLLLTADTFCEETGWRAFALPRFPDTRSRLANTVVLGVLLAGWHLPVALSEGSGVVPYLTATIASTVVTNWIYYNGRQSALLAWLYHTTANTAGQYFVPLLSARNRVAYFWVLSGVNIATAVILVLASGRTWTTREHDVRQP